MAGIYIHIPFCRKKCDYCNFFSLATTRFRDAYTNALSREIDLTRDYLNNAPIETLYFGGGTPSLLTISELQNIIEKARGSRFNALENNPVSLIKAPRSTTTNSQQGAIPEITLELNPEDVTQDYLAMLSQTPVNRLSLGIQSFFDDDLQYLGRNHSALQAKKALKRILLSHQKPNPENKVSVDLIFGIPTLTDDRWRENLQQIIDLGIPHLSAYALTVEPRTPLAWKLAREKHSISPITSRVSTNAKNQPPRIPLSYLPPSEEQAADQFSILMEEMEQAGYVQYEISNFCLPGYESRHNSAYWKGVPYLGLGPSAHSFNGVSRRWNPSNLTRYIQGIALGIPVYEEETLTNDQRFNEYVMTSLRTCWGCDTKKISTEFGLQYGAHFRNQAALHLASGHLVESEGIMRLTRSGKFLADRISAELFL